MEREAERAGPQRLLFFVRYVLPAMIILAGLALAVAGLDIEGAFGIIGAGIAVGLLNLFYRIGASGERDRDAEEAAREYFDRHGEWPPEPERRPRQWRMPEGVAMPENRDEANR